GMPAATRGSGFARVRMAPPLADRRRGAASVAPPHRRLLLRPLFSRWHGTGHLGKRRRTRLELAGGRPARLSNRPQWGREWRRVFSGRNSFSNGQRRPDREDIRHSNLGGAPDESATEWRGHRSGLFTGRPAGP